MGSNGVFSWSAGSVGKGSYDNAYDCGCYNHDRDNCTHPEGTVTCTKNVRDCGISGSSCQLWHSSVETGHQVSADNKQYNSHDQRGYCGNNYPCESFSVASELIIEFFKQEI